MNYTKNILLILFIFLNFSLGYSQVTIPSPNVASISEQAIVPKSGFTGQANVQVPIYSVNYKELSIPINLSYNTQGNKVKEHPGFVGLGWSMSSGGLIYRKANGPMDEYPSDLGYYNNIGKVVENYNNQEYVKNYALDGGNKSNYLYDGMPDEFVFNFNGYSGIFFITKRPESSSLDLVFRPNGDYNLKGEIVEIKDNVHFKRNSASEGFEDPTILSRCIYTIKITDDLGYIYIFGNAPENIEFGNIGNLVDNKYNVANTWHLSKITAPNGYSIDFSYEKKGLLIIPDTYREAVAIHKSAKFSAFSHLIVVFAGAWGSKDYEYKGDSQKSSYYVSSPSYLKSIKTPEQEVLFRYSRSNDLQYDLYKYIFPTFNEFLDQNDVSRGSGSSDYKTSSWQKLDEIEVKETGKIIKLKYRENNTTRLRLDSILFGFKALNIFQKEKQYAFFYNSLQLPDYESRKSDHWGFYNGRAYAYNSDYYNTRQPDSNFLQAEILKQIQYPNGGYIEFEYEPHYYKKIARQFPFIIDDETITVNTMAGGVRLKAVETKIDINTTATKTEYYYNKNYINGGTTSSGILSGIPKYGNSGTRYTSYSFGGFWLRESGTSSFYYQIGRDQNLFPLSTTNGNHVTYTEVTEKTGNGYITTTYSNHDNGYTDISPSLMHSNFDSEALDDPFISNQAYRGLPLFVKTYSQQKEPVKEIQNIYTINTQSDNDVPFLQRVVENLIGGIRASSGKYPVSPALISSTIENNYFDNAATQSNEVKYYRLASYMLDGKLTRLNKPSAIVRSNTSKTGIITTSYSYPVAFTGGLQTTNDLKIKAAESFAVAGETGVYADMVLKHIIAPTIVQTISRNDADQMSLTKPISLTKTNFGRFDFGLLLPKSTEIKTGDKETVISHLFNKYDSKGNLLEMQQPKGPITSYIWGYKGQYPIAEIKNASYEEISIPDTESMNIRDYGKFTSPVGFEYVIDGTAPMGNLVLNMESQIGVISSSELNLNPSKTYVASYWENSSKLTPFCHSSNITIVSDKVIKQHGNWKLRETKLKNATGDIDFHFDEMGLIQNLNIYPVDASLTTYSYKPMVGMTSSTNSRGEIIYYEYDTFQRLKHIKDQKGNIIKSYDYNYKP